MSTLLEDKDAIRELLANYCFRSDHGDTDGLLELFTENCVWDGGASGRFESRRAFREFLIAATTGEAKIRHFTANEVISVKGDTATARSYFMLLNCTSSPPIIVFAGFYEDQLVRTGGRWLFKTRTALAT